MTITHWHMNYEKPDEGKRVIIRRRNFIGEEPILSEAMWKYSTETGKWHSAYGGQLDDEFVTHWSYAE